jgi:hypothetical protein
MSWWSDPTAKHAFILAWASVVLEAIAASAGVIFYLVCRILLLPRLVCVCVCHGAV